MKIEQLSVLTMVVIAFAALAALVLTGQSGIRQALRAIQTDLLAGQAELRKDLRAVEAELRTGQSRIRNDLNAPEVRLAAVERRTAGLSREPGASEAEPTPAAAPGG